MRGFYPERGNGGKANLRCNSRTLALVSTRRFPIASAKPTPLAFPALNLVRRFSEIAPFFASSV
jgi:hypothetical protein